VAVSIRTFNLNNLFSRFNFTADLSTATGAAASVDEQTTFRFSDPQGFRIRKYQGRLVKGKDPADTAKLVERIKRIDLDVLAIQEAEDIDTLRAFVRDDLDGLYPYVVLVEGNDPRLIDVGLLSKLPLGAITSWQTTPDPAATSRRLFSRDLLQVEVLSTTGKARLLTVFVNHLKSHFVPFTDPDPVAAGVAADQLRERQVNAAIQIISSQTRPNSRYVVCGDMNDPPDSPALGQFADPTRLGLHNALTDPGETRPPPAENPPPANTAWTERFKQPQKPAVHTLMDQVWLSPALKDKQTGAFIDRRTRLSGDGSDHDPAWVTLEL
jgi:endonuclease/exonuclease/phosphatase family metal-dependent hydrolase